MTNKGTKTSPLDIMYFFESLTIQPPQNKFIAKRCIQISIKNELSEKRYNNSARLKYSLKNISRIIFSKGIKKRTFSTTKKWLLRLFYRLKKNKYKII